MKRWLLVAVVLWPALALAQQPVGPFPATTAPLLGLPAQQGSSTNPFTNIVFTGQALGPDSCTAYSFTSAPTTGYGYNGTLLCMAVAGSNIFTVSATAVASTAPFFGPVSATVPIYSVTGDTNTGYGASAADTLALFAGGTTPRVTVTTTAATSTVPYVAPATGTAAATVYNFGTAGTGLYGDATSVRFAVGGNQAFFIDNAQSAVSVVSLNLCMAPGSGIADVCFSRVSGSLIATSAGDNFGVGSGSALFLASAAWTNTAPSGPVACTSPTVTWSNGTAAFQIDVGGTCAAVSTLVVTLPAVTNAYICTAMNVTTSATAEVEMTASTTTTATFTNYTRTTGLALAWVDGTDVRIGCTGG